MRHASNGQTTIEACLALAEAARAASDWRGADGRHMVGLYAWLHSQVYSVEASELRDAKQLSKAIYAASKRMGEVGGPDEMVRFLAWAFKRERGKDSGRRLTWQLACTHAGVLDDYRLDAGPLAVPPVSTKTDAAADNGQAAPDDTIEALDYAALCRLADAERAGLLIDDLPILPGSGVVTLAGAPHAGKSTLAAVLAVAVMSSASVFGHAPAVVGPVIWVHLEHAASELRALIRRAAAGLGVDPHDLPLHVIRQGPGGRRWSLDDPSCVGATRAYADRIGAVAVVIDPVRRATAAKENDSGEMSLAYAHGAQLTSEGRRLVVMIHHVGISGRVRGSTDIEAVSDSTVYLTRHKPREPQDGRRVVEVTAQHHSRAEYREKLRIDEDDEAIRVGFDDADRPAAPAPKDRARDAIREVLAGICADGKPKELPRGELLRLAKGNTEAKRTALDAMVRDKRVIERAGTRGAKLYSLAPTEEAHHDD